MSIEIYKELNKELINKVRELKKVNSILEKELNDIKGRYFEEVQSRSEERQLIRTVISGLKTRIDIAESHFNGDDSARRGGSNNRTDRRRVRSSGVTTRSPIRLSSHADQNPELSPHSESDNSETLINNSRDGLNPGGLEVIAERSPRPDSNENTLVCFSQLTISDVPKQTAVERNSRRKAIIPPMLTVTNCEESNETIEYSAVSQTAEDRESNSAVSVASDLSMRDFASTAVHSSPIPFESSDKSKAQTDSNFSDTNNSTLRPRRNRSAISYTEPSLNVKMRNENETKPPIKTRRSKKKSK